MVMGIISEPPQTTALQLNDVDFRFLLIVYVLAVIAWIGGPLLLDLRVLPQACLQ